MASLCTLRLLNQLDDSAIAQGRIKCVAFAAPALGNRALAEIVQQRGWSHVFYNLTLPGEPVLAAPSVCIAACTLAKVMGGTKSSLSNKSSFLNPSRLGCACQESPSHSILAHCSLYCAIAQDIPGVAGTPLPLQKNSCLLSVCTA